MTSNRAQFEALFAGPDWRRLRQLSGQRLDSHQQDKPQETP
ncbi:hypothetical protein [Leisingera sp. F5]|nr:hypothetical protein [Leisingera sp. F5]